MRSSIILFITCMCLISTASADMGYPQQDVLDDTFNMIGDIYDFVISIPQYLSDMLNNLLHAILYPFEVLLSIIIDVLNAISQIWSDFKTALWTITNSLYAFAYSGLSILLPDELVNITMLVIPIAVILRIYFIVRGSS